MLVMPLRALGMWIGQAQRATASGRAHLPGDRRAGGDQGRARRRELPPGPGRVTFDGVTFGYDPDRPVLHDVDLELEPGRIVALIGHTGSGKTTLASLVPRFYDVQAGRVSIDGVDVRDVTLASLRREIGVIAQDPFLFSATVRENIAFGRPEATDEEIERAARLAQAHEFVEALPEGYDTVIGERGITLSGGQRQRVAIARALVVDPRILILDDATASVDATTEAKIRAGLREAMRGRTTIIIAHRLSTIALADEMIVLEDGRIAARGSHDDLVDDERGLPRDLRARPARARASRRKSREARPPARRPPDARRPAAGRGLVVGADEAAAERSTASPARTAGAPRSRSSRCSARPPSRSRRPTSSGARSTRYGAARRTCSCWLVVAFVAAGVLGIVFSYAQTYFTGWTGERMLADLRNQLFRHLQRLSLGFYERNRAGVIISRLTNDVEALDQLVTDGVTSLVQNTLTLVGTAVVLFFLDWRLALATLTVMPLMALATAWFRKRSGAPTARCARRSALVTATLAEDIAGMRVLQSFTREGAAQENFRQIADDYRVANMQTVVLNGIYFPVVDFLSSAATAVVLGYGGWLVCHGHESIGILVAFLGYLSNFFDPVQQLSQLYNTFLSAVAALDKITDLLDEAPEVEDAADARQLDVISGRVRFEDVHFAYGRGPEVLHGIDLDVPAGTTVALVGHTGRRQVDDRQAARPLLRPDRAGASRSTAPTCATSRRHSLRRQLGIVPQEGFLFAGTVAENIAFGRPDATREEIIAAARAVGADEFIERLEDGYETQLGERGSRLSLGQRQLVAFARALLADPRILILDEATSSVDIGTERKIERALRRLLEGRTAFIIAHRLSTIRDADLIVVLEHGQVVEQGTHDELLASRGLYMSLYGDWAADVA